MGVYVGPEFNVKNKVFYKLAPDSWTNDFHNYTVTWNTGRTHKQFRIKKIPGIEGSLQFFAHFIDKISFQVDGEELGAIQPESGQTIRDIVGLPKDIEYVYNGSGNKLAPFDKE
ncbi:hypothetical protein U1Q18_052212, partial [Sarracenia purpurea var. burkii]